MVFWAGAPPRNSVVEFQNPEAGSQKSEAKLTPPKPEAGFRWSKTRKSAPQAGPTTSRRKLAGACSAVQAHGGVLFAERQKREPRGGGATVTAGSARGCAICRTAEAGAARGRCCCHCRSARGRAVQQKWGWQGRITALLQRSPRGVLCAAEAHGGG